MGSGKKKEGKNGGRGNLNPILILDSEDRISCTDLAC